MSEQEIRVLLARLEGKLDTNTASVDGHMRSVEQRLASAEADIKANKVDTNALWKREHKREGERKVIIGIAGGVGTVGAAIGTVIMKFLLGGLPI